jgi:hypothetical protein
VQLLDAFEGGIGVYVPEGETGCAVFEEGFCGFESEGTCSASNWKYVSPRGWQRSGARLVLLFSRTDRIAVDFETELCSFCRLEIVWRWTRLRQWTVCCRKRHFWELSVDERCSVFAVACHLEF